MSQSSFSAGTADVQLNFVCLFADGQKSRLSKKGWVSGSLQGAVQHVVRRKSKLA